MERLSFSCKIVLVLGFVCSLLSGFIIANLVVSDLIIGCLIPLSISTLLHQHWHFNSIACTISGYLLTIANCAANWALCLVSIERYFAIKCPFQHGTYMKYIKYITAVLWLFILSHNAVMLHYEDGFVMIEDMYVCGPNLRSYPLYILLLNVFDLFLPNGIICYTYVKIYQEVRRHSQEIAVNTLRSTTTRGDDLDQYETQTSTEWKAALVIIAIVGVFNVCWIPFGIGMLSYAMGAHMPYGLAASLFWITLTNAAINPLVYTLLHRAYRKELMKLVSCVKKTVNRPKPVDL